MKSEVSYQVLARKWRPRNFENMVGQEHVLKTLSNALNTDRLHHAYLFAGTRGVGKTTLARILAKCLNCEQGVSATPCDACSACKSIDEGRFVDLIEVDAASRARVEETRDLMDNVQYLPSTGRYKVYLIDEIHMFSNHSFNALLKTLEEPPPHVKFLLATTEPKKLPITILSRCLQFNLKHLTDGQIGDQLGRIISSEELSFDEKSIALIARAANGSMRDALSLLDQAIAYSNGSLAQAQIREMLGAIDSVEVDKLLQALIDNDPQTLLEQVDNIARYNADYDSVLSELSGRLHDIAVSQVLGSDNDQMDSDVNNLARNISKEDVQLYYQIALNGRRDLYISHDQRSGFEMTLIRMLAFQPHYSEPGRLKKPEMTGAKKNIQALKPENEIKKNIKKNIKKDIKHEADAINAGNADWTDIIESMQLDGLTREMASQCVISEMSDNTITLALSPVHQQFLDTVQKDRLIAALKNHYGDKFRVKIDIQELKEESPSAKRMREEKEKHEQAVGGFISDPDVKSIVETFDGKLNEESIQGR